MICSPHGFTNMLPNSDFFKWIFIFTKRLVKKLGILINDMLTSWFCGYTKFRNQNFLQTINCLIVSFLFQQNQFEIRENSELEILKSDRLCAHLMVSQNIPNFRILVILKRKRSLKLGKLKIGICKIECSMSWTKY